MVDIVICVHNAPRDVAHCLTSVRETLRPTDRAIIVDDGSAGETQRICARFSASAPDQMRLIRRPSGSGFCKAANTGLAASTADMVVLLNSDTIVSGDWIARLERCMASNWQIGIVGPLSNAGGWQSVPKLPSRERASNPVCTDVDTLRQIHAQCSGFANRFGYPVVEQINGFCIGLSRALIDAVGVFDEARFPMGYGEENDLTFRALDAGFLCAVAVDCFVYHAKSKSYSSDARARYNAAGQKQLHALHGHARVSSAVRNTQRHPVLRTIRQETARDFAEKGWIRDTEPAA